jgi:hypothetical protein
MICLDTRLGELTAESSALDSHPYCLNFLRPIHSGAISIGLIRRLLLGSNTQN